MSSPAAPVRKAGDGLWWLAALLAALAGIGLRFSGLGIQSYWTDETFSVLQASDTWGHLIDVARTEIHPPLYPALLKVWIDLGNSGPLWTRALGALLGALGVAVSWAALRRTRIPAAQRAAVVALTALNGFAITYAQEVRPYALLWLAAVGVTATAWAWAEEPRPGRLGAFLAWGLIASATHLFGAILVLAATVTMATWRRTAPLALGLATMGAIAPQALWLGIGLATPGFAAGASRWIAAPTGGSVRDVATTVFAAGDLTMLDEGFVWRSPWLALLTGAVVLVSAVTAVAGSSRRAGDEPVPHPAGFWGLLAGLLLGACWVGSQAVHLWTLRNMIIVAPSLTWAAGTACWELLRRPALRIAALATLLACCTLALVQVQRDLATPYKTDFAGAMEYLAEVRTQEPSAHFALSTLNPDAWMLSADLPASPEYLTWLLGDAQLVEKDAFSSVLTPRAGASVYVWYRSTDPDGAAGRATAMLNRLGRDGCVQVPMQGIAVVRCERPQ